MEHDTRTKETLVLAKKMHPVGKWMVAIREDTAEVGGIILPDRTKDSTSVALLARVGPGVKDERLKEGVKVVVDMYSNHEFRLRGDVKHSVWMVNEDMVRMILED
jgi:co-chaperonin GroES (HSP10)